MTLNFIIQIQFKNKIVDSRSQLLDTGIKLHGLQDVDVHSSKLDIHRLFVDCPPLKYHP